MDVQKNMSESDDDNGIVISMHSEEMYITFEEPYLWKKEDVIDIVDAFREKKSSNSILSGGGNSYWNFYIRNGVGYIMYDISGNGGDSKFMLHMTRPQTKEVIEAICNYFPYLSNK